MTTALDLLCPDCGHHTHLADTAPECRWRDCRCGFTVRVPADVEVRRGAIQLDRHDSLELDADGSRGNVPALLVLQNGSYNEVALAPGRWVMRRVDA